MPPTYYTPLFTSKANNKEFHIDLYNDTSNPYISFELNIDEQFKESKQGVQTLYIIMAQNKIKNEIKNNSNLNSSSFYVHNSFRKIDITNDEDDLTNSIKQIKNLILNSDFSEIEINKSKEQAKKLYLEYFNNGDNGELDLFHDIQQGTTPSDFNNFIDNITFDDIKKYNQDFINQSKTCTVLLANKTWYNNNKKDILPILYDF